MNMDIPSARQPPLVTRCEERMPSQSRMCGQIACVWLGAWSEWADLHDSLELKGMGDKA